MGMTEDDLKQECKYCYREVDASGLEGFRCTNKTVNMETSWCRPKNANEPCSICEYCKPREEMKITINEIIKKENEIAAKYQKAVDTHIVNDNGCTIEEMCGDNSEAISKHLSLCKSIADYHKQIADTMRKYQQIQGLVEYHMLRFLPKERMSGFQKDVLEVLENGTDD